METMFFLWNKVEAITWYALKKKLDGKIFEKSSFFHFLQVGPVAAKRNNFVISS